MTLTSEVEKALDFARRYHQETGNIPSVRRVCREANLTPPRFYRVFKNLEGFCERAGIKIDRETLVRIKGTRKATKRRTREKRRQLPRDPNPPAPPTVESQNIEMETESTFEKLQQGLKDKEAAQGSIRENARKFAEEFKTLALTGHPDVNGPILEALGEVMPSVLFYKYDIAADIQDLLSANDVLHQVQEERKKLNDEEKKNATERADIAKEWERLKRDSDKASLLEHVEKLEWQRKVNTNRFNETYDALKRFRVTFRELWKIASKCPDCPKTFMQNMMASHGDILEWITSGKYTRLSFETEDKPRLPGRT
ncbi:hypothetical protein MUP77_09655 [Candidatus Bathyarchaeota archaeon]|nr:hypothetical protein [Candidatus Bathyarchaeota archaeon]